MHRLFVVTLLLLSACEPALAGYVVTVRPQVSPKYTVVYDETGPVSALNPGPVVAPPAGAVRRICAEVDIYGTDPVQRSEVWETNAPASDPSSALLAACPSIRATLAAVIRAEGARRLAALANPYTPEERETWATQQAEAEAWTADPSAPTPMLSAMAAGRGIPLSLLVEKVMENVELFRVASGQILGRQQALLDRVATEQDFAALLAISW